MKLRLSESGDTLIEVVFALLILSSVLVGSFGLVRISRTNTGSSLLRSQAINMMQEQYNALKSYRDNNTASWSAFEMGVYNSIKGDPGCSPLNPSTTSANACLFHMERDPSAAGTAYGQWVPCAGSWYPPLDNDTGWNTLATACQGNARTQAAQPNISVSIQLMSPMNCNGLGGNPGNPYFGFQVNSTWVQGSISASDTSALSTILANIRGDVVTTC